MESTNPETTAQALVDGLDKGNITITPAHAELHVRAGARPEEVDCYPDTALLVHDTARDFILFRVPVWVACFWDAQGHMRSGEPGWYKGNTDGECNGAPRVTDDPDEHGVIRIEGGDEITTSEIKLDAYAGSRGNPASDDRTLVLASRLDEYLQDAYAQIEVHSPSDDEERGWLVDTTDTAYSLVIDFDNEPAVDLRRRERFYDSPLDVVAIYAGDSIGRRIYAVDGDPETRLFDDAGDAVRAAIDLARRRLDAVDTALAAARDAESIGCPQPLTHVLRDASRSTDPDVVPSL